MKPVTSAVAAALIALCAGAPARADGLLIFGISNEGGGANPFERVIDLATGHERLTLIQGPSSSQEGYDGQLWSYYNGARNIIDMPSDIRDKRARMWLRQSGWQVLGRPGESRRRLSMPGMSGVELNFDAVSHHVSKAIIDGDYGPISVSFADWRPVGRYVYPFRQEIRSDIDGQTVLTAHSVSPLSNVDSALLARPPAASLASLAAPWVTVPFTLVGSRGSHTQVTAVIDGKAGDFIFDTGAANILTIDAAKRMQVATSGGINIGGVGEGTDNGGFGLVKRVSIGSASLDNQAFVVIPSPFPPTNGQPSPTAGLLGYEFLAQFVTTIDYRAQTMTFRKAVPPDQKGLRLPFVTDDHAIAINAQLNGAPILVRLDTGDGGTLTFFPAYTAATGLDRGTGAAKIVGGGAGGSVSAKGGVVDGFSFAGVPFPRLPVHFSQNRSGAFASKALAANLGAGVLRCFRMTLDYAHHQLWMEPQLDTPGCTANSIRRAN